ncbi:glycoside hydrolase family 35 protein [Hypoxylon sp. EC38]|nr:glycoside hydrolase family 35 protein [Hypoxylon sp. EC38]
MDVTLTPRGLHVPPRDVNSKVEPRDQLEGLVEWDQYSMIIRGERMFIFSGEFHPWRLPSPGLWLGIFQKIKALGFNAVSFYTYWGLVEGTQGKVRFDGVFALDEFFKAAAEAGIYLIARPGPYINAETALGGYPGSTARIKAPLRGDDPEFIDTTELYAATVGKLIADAQITNGGPVIMLQLENEYDTWPDVNNTDFPAQLNINYMEHVKQQFKNAGNVVPQMNVGIFLGDELDVTVNNRFQSMALMPTPCDTICIGAHPDVWPKIRWPENWQLMHQKYSSNTPFFVAEFQGGSGTGFGGVNADACNALVNQESIRVLWKNNYRFAIKIFNIYMTYGGTNWGNLGYRGGDSSYDYGVSIKENRHIWREKYSEEKLEANFFKVSPAYLTAVADNASNGSYVSIDQIATTPTSTNTTTYKLIVLTSAGNLTIPKLGGELVLTRRDSKIHVVDYDVAGINLVYCTAEIFTWAQDASGKRTIILYGGAGELHEFAIDLTTLTTSAQIILSDTTWKYRSRIIHLRLNPQPLLTPTSLYASDYGFHSGSLIYRGHFTANGNESYLFLNLTGGNDFGYSFWLNNSFVTSWDGTGLGGGEPSHNDTISLVSHSLESGKPYVFTLLIDHMGQDEEAPGTDAIKSPMGLINFDLVGHVQSDVTWKLTGNLGGESYHDLERGPRNEDGIKSAGVGFFTTTFELDVPAGYDVPMSFVFANSTSTSAVPTSPSPSTPSIATISRNHRIQLFVNGWQFGKFVANIGPQTSLPVPEGILNHNGLNTVALTLWSLDGGGTRLDGFSLEPEMPLWSGYRKPWLAPQPAWREREGAY